MLTLARDRGTLSVSNLVGLCCASVCCVECDPRQTGANVCGEVCGGPTGPVQVPCVLAAAVLAAGFSTSTAFEQPLYAHLPTAGQAVRRSIANARCRNDAVNQADGHRHPSRHRRFERRNPSSASSVSNEWHSDAKRRTREMITALRSALGTSVAASRARAAYVRDAPPMAHEIPTSAARDRRGPGLRRPAG